MMIVGLLDLLLSLDVSEVQIQVWLVLPHLELFLQVLEFPHDLALVLL